MKNVVVVGYGAMGKGIAELLVEKQGIALKAIIEKRQIENEANLVNVKGDQIPLHKTIEEFDFSEIDLAIVAISSYLKVLYPTLEQLVKNKVNVITIGEEMAYPSIVDKELVDQLDQIAKENNVSILGTGINPGFIFDTLIVALTSTSFSVDQIKAIRANDLSAFGVTVLDSQGVGCTVEEYEEKEKTGEVVGHIGFPQSVHMIAEALGWEIDEVIEEKRPIISTETLELKDRTIKPGMVKGCDHRVIAKSNGNVVIDFQHPQQVYPEKTKDEIKIIGTPDIHLTITPEIPGGIGTIAIAVNVIPLLLNAKAGMLSMLDLPGLPSIFRNGVIKV